MNDCLQAALHYRDLGLSIIPVQKNKKPYIAWEKYQKEIANVELIKQWWERYPTANVAIVTGEISNLDVIDVDSEQAMNALAEILPDTLVTPTARTPRGGWHYYHQSMNGLGNAIGFMENCDFKGNGGYIIAPPSSGYSWLPNLNILEVDPAPLPDSVLKVIKTATQRPEPDKVRHADFSKGTRDDSLFHTALNLLKGGMPLEEVQKIVVSLASTCNPPFPAKEALIKVESAAKRLQTGDRNLTQDIRDWIETSTGEFLTRNIFEELDIAPGKKSTVSMILKRLAEEGLIERAGRKTGCFRRIEKDLVKLDLFAAKKESVRLTLPFAIDKMVRLMPGNVIVVAGAINAGKSAFLLNVAKDNMDKFKVHYFTSEMGVDELALRAELFDDIAFERWRDIDIYERTENFHDVIVPGRGNLNIIDFLELYEDFWIVAKRIAEIHRKLDGAIAIIALQKNPGVDVGLGGQRSIEKARLALSMEKGMLKIVKAKNWKGTENPNGKAIKFKIVNGCKLIQVDDWTLD